MDVERLIGVILFVHKASNMSTVRPLGMIECENDRYLRSTIRQSLQCEHENHELQTTLLLTIKLHKNDSTTSLHQPLSCLEIRHIA